MTAPADVAVARDAIRQLAAVYAHGVDRGRFGEVVALFAPQGVLEVDDGRRMTGHDEITAFFRSTADDVRNGRARPLLLRHHVSSHHILVESRYAARGWAYFVVFTERGPDHWGRYRDAYVHTTDGWRFASRHVRIDGAAEGSWATARHPD